MNNHIYKWINEWTIERSDKRDVTFLENKSLALSKWWRCRYGSHMARVEVDKTKQKDKKSNLPREKRDWLPSNILSRTFPARTPTFVWYHWKKFGKSIHTIMIFQHVRWDLQTTWLQLQTDTQKDLKHDGTIFDSCFDLLKMVDYHWVSWRGDSQTDWQTHPLTKMRGCIQGRNTQPKIK